MKLFYIATLVTVASSFTAPLSRTPTVSSNTALFAVDANGANGAVSKKKVMVLGGDGFCGWPTSLYLSDQGHEVVIVDDLSRRKIDLDLGCDSLTPVQSPEVRVEKALFCLVDARLCLFGSWNLLDSHLS